MNFRRTTSFVAAAACAVATLAGVASLAHADDRDDAPKQTVRYDDLNLSTQAGLQTLYRRIQHAARSVCGPALVTGTRIVSAARNDCVNTSIRQAILTVNQPSLTAYYAARFGIPAAGSTG
jgi:UrcA family protein